MELLLLLLQAPRSGYKPTLEALLLHGILRHAEFVVTEANLVYRLFFWVDLLIFLFGLLEGGLVRFILFFGAIWIIFVSGAGIAVAGLGAAPTTPMLCFSSRGIILHCLIAIGFLRSVHHIYIYIYHMRRWPSTAL